MHFSCTGSGSMSHHVRVIRHRIGRGSIYEHHGSWWIYNRNGKKHCRRRIGSNPAMAECEASLLNAEPAAAEENLSIREILTRWFESEGPSMPTDRMIPAPVIYHARKNRSALRNCDISSWTITKGCFALPWRHSPVTERQPFIWRTSSRLQGVAPARFPSGISSAICER
jgi:hypothetical protein